VAKGRYVWAWSEGLVYEMQVGHHPGRRRLTGLALAQDEPDTAQWAARPASTYVDLVVMSDVLRVTPQTARVLEAFLASPTQPQYGFELSRATRLQSGSLYPILARLEGVGVVESGWEGDDAERKGPRRRYYRFTRDGAQRAQALLVESRRASAGLSGTALRPVLGAAK
jgi:PadR family transcriptional regulator PadR